MALCTRGVRIENSDDFVVGLADVSKGVSGPGVD